MNRGIVFAMMLLGLSRWVVGQNRDWTVELKCPQVFIENLGQYDEAIPSLGSSVKYSIDHGFGWQIFLTPSAVAYKIQRCESPGEREEGELKSGPEEVNSTIETTIATLSWMNANPTANFGQTDKTSEYFTYSYEKDETYINLDHVDAYRKIFVNEIYPGIDITYEPWGERGMKYGFEVDAHADPSLIRGVWSGGTPVLDAEGNIHIGAVLGELVDHKPRAWYADDVAQEIPCEFALSGNEVRFVLGSYDHNRAIVIDPWTVNPALPAPFNRAFEVDADAAGNVWVWGGGMGYNLKKYNAAGTLQWTHVSPWDTSNAWFGELLVLDAGDAFITSGSAAKLRRLTAAGATTFTNNGPFFNLDEYWTMIQNCNKTKLLIGGTRLVGLSNPRAELFDVSMISGNQIAPGPYQQQFACGCTFIITLGCEFRMLQIGMDGYIYGLTNDSIFKLNPTFGRVWGTSHGNMLSYYSPAYMAQSVQGINGIDAATSDFYVNWGNTLQRRSNANGAVVSSVAIPGGAYANGCGVSSGMSNSGCVLDNCGNVYVGSAANVYKYNSTLGLLSSVAVSSTVYDLHVATGGVLLIGGNAFLTSNTSLLACAPKTVTCPVALGSEFSSFTGTCNDEKAILEWRSSPEAAVAKFEVERSGDGEIWEKRGSLIPRDSELQQNFFRFEDHQEAGISKLYRIHMINGNGESVYSEVLPLGNCNEPENGYRVFPTLASNEFSVIFTSEISQSVSIEIMSTEGKVMKKILIHANEGLNHSEIKIPGLASGCYLVTLTGNSISIPGHGQKLIVE